MTSVPGVAADAAVRNAIRMRLQRPMCGKFLAPTLHKQAKRFGTGTAMISAADNPAHDFVSNRSGRASR